jgi:hypothetical protein
VIKSVLRMGSVAALAASILMPVNVAARGFTGHGAHGFRHHYGYWPYGGSIVAYPFGRDLDAVGTVPAQADPTTTPAPRCVHSHETVTVPSEDGGVRQITVTRC